MVCFACLTMHVNQHKTGQVPFLRVRAFRHCDGQSVETRRAPLDGSLQYALM